MLDLLSQILGYIWDLLPRPVIVGPTERASCWWLGRYPRDCGPGVYLIWPIFMHWKIIPVVSQICETAIIAVDDMNGQAWQFRLAVEYEVSDVLQYDVSSFSGQNHIEQVAAYSLAALVSHNPTSYFRETPLPKVARVVKARTESSLSDRGVRILRVRIVMASRCRPLFLSQAERLVD